MRHGFDIDGLIDTLAERVAQKVRAELTRPGSVQPRLLSVEQGAVYLGRSKASVQHMIADRRLSVVRDGRRVFLDVRELDRWIEANKEPAEDLTDRAA